MQKQIYQLKQQQTNQTRQPYNKSTLSDIARIHAKEVSKESRQPNKQIKSTINLRQRFTQQNFYISSKNDHQNQIQYNLGNTKTCNAHPVRVNVDNARHIQSNFSLKPNKFIIKNTGLGSGVLGSGSIAVTGNNQSYTNNMSNKMNGTIQSISQQQLQKHSYLNHVTNGQQIISNNHYQNHIKSSQNIQIQQNATTILSKEQINFKIKHQPNMSRQMKSSSCTKGKDQQTSVDNLHHQYQFNDSTIQIMHESSKGWNQMRNNTYDNTQQDKYIPNQIFDPNSNELDNLSYSANHQRSSHRSQNMNYFEKSTDRTKSQLQDKRGVHQVSNSRNAADPTGMQTSLPNQADVDHIQIINGQYQYSAHIRDATTDSHENSTFEANTSPRCNQPQVGAPRKMESPIKLLHSPGKMHPKDSSKEAKNQNSQHSRLVKKKNGVIYKQHLLSSNNQAKIIKQNHKNNAKEVIGQTGLLRESVHFPNMPMTNADYPVSGISSAGAQNFIHNTNAVNDQTLTMRSSVYDQAKTKSQQGLIQMTNIQNLHQNLKILNNSQSNWKKRITNNAGPGAATTSAAQLNELEQTPLGLANPKMQDHNGSMGHEYCNQAISAQKQIKNRNRNHDKLSNNFDGLNSRSVNKNNCSRSTSHQHSFQSLPELPELSELPELPEIPVDQHRDTFESINEQDEIMESQAQISQDKPGVNGNTNTNQLPRLVNLPSAKHIDDNQLKLNQIRVKNNFTFKNGLHYQLNNKTRNPNAQQIPSNNSKGSNKNVTPSVNKGGLMNHFDFKHESQRTSQNDSINKNFGGNSNHQATVVDAYKELVSVKTTPQKVNNANARGIYQPCNSEANNSLNQSISIHNASQKSRHKMTAQQQTQKNDKHHNRHAQSPDFKHHITNKEQNQTQREKAKQYDTIGPSISSNDINNSKSIQSIQIVDEKFKSRGAGVNSQQTNQKMLASFMQKNSRSHIQLNPQAEDDDKLNDSANDNYQVRYKSRLNDQSKQSSQNQSMKMESDRRTSLKELNEKDFTMKDADENMHQKNREKLNLTPSEFQTEVDQRQIEQENLRKFQRRNNSNGMKQEEYQGIRIQISKEKKIKQHLVENPVFCSDQGFVETNKNTISLHDDKMAAQCDNKHIKSYNQMYNNNNTNSNNSLQVMKDTESIEYIANSEDPSNNLLFYNFNAYNPGNNLQKKIREPNNAAQMNSYELNEDEIRGGILSRQSRVSSKADSKSSLRSRGKYIEFDSNQNQLRKNNDYEDGARPQIPGAGSGMARKPSQKQVFKDRQVQSAQSSKYLRKQPGKTDKENLHGHGHVNGQNDEDSDQERDSQHAGAINDSSEQLANGKSYFGAEQSRIDIPFTKNLKTHYGNGMLSSKPLDPKDVQLAGQFRSGNHAQGSSSVSNSQQSQMGLKTVSHAQDARQTQTTMAVTSATEFQGVASLEFEDVGSGGGTASRGGSSSLPRIIAPQEGISNAASSAMNFGRNTLYNPKKSTDFFDLFQAGDALATSAAAASLVRPQNKAESRRGSSNSHLGRIQRKNIGQFGFGLRSNSRKDNVDSTSDSFGFGALAKHSSTSTDSQNFELQNFVRSLKQSHQNHNRRKDFPSRKSACGSTAMSQVSSSMGSLKGHHSVSHLNPMHSNLKKISPSSPNNVGNMGGGNAGVVQIHEMIEEEVELEQKEELDSSSQGSGQNQAVEQEV